ncbi:trna -lysidine synthetase [Lasius niger]|uniref:Trna-lysidine synthetase n=1 Tax=Lasius niger TaxID=67767 RepID=A0A0J7NY59_LASNI|nr:trna -lysidine synthetase [Lasius niger]
MMRPFNASGEPIPWAHLLNPCDIDAYPCLVRAGKYMAKGWSLFIYGADCPCCLAARLIGALVAAFALGAFAAL